MSGFLTAMNAFNYGHLRKNYIISKFRKILPIYWGATIGVFVLGRVFPSLFSSMKFTWINLAYSLFLIPGHTFILYPGWTLTYFFLFYIVYWLADKFFCHRDIACSVIIVVSVLLGYLSSALFLGNMFEKCANPIMLEFVYGIILYYITLKEKSNLIKMEQVRKILAFLLIVILFFDYNKYLGVRWLLPSFFTCVSIYCIICCNFNSKFFELLSRIGNISLVVYILHPLIIRPVDKIVMRITGSYISPVYFIGVFVGVSLTICICFGMQRLFKLLHIL